MDFQKLGSAGRRLSGVKQTDHKAGDAILHRDSKSPPAKSALEFLDEEEVARLLRPHCRLESERHIAMQRALHRHGIRRERPPLLKRIWRRLARALLILMAVVAGASLPIVAEAQTGPRASATTLPGAPQTGEFAALTSLPQRTQEIVALVAVQARIAADGEAASAAIVSGEDPTRSVDSQYASSRPQDLLTELADWLDVHGTPDLNAQLKILASTEQEIVGWFYRLMDTAAPKNGNERTERIWASSQWLVNRMNLAQKRNVHAWELMLWGLISELSQDPIERVSLWSDATAFAERMVQSTTY